MRDEYGVEVVNLETTFQSLTAGGLALLLEAHGLRLYGGRTRGYRDINTGAHAVVITGIKGDNVFINDPWPPNQGAQLTMSYRDLAR